MFMLTGTRIVCVTARVSASGVSPATSIVPSRSFSTTPLNQKGPAKMTKETLKKADRAISDAAVKGIDTCEKAMKKMNEVFSYATKEAEGKVSQIADEAKGKAQEMEGEARGKQK